MSDESNARAKISIEKNGPLKITGLSRFLNSRGERIETKKTMSLCRCGASKSKPYCDGTHASIEFIDEKSGERIPDALDRYEGKAIAVLDNRGVCSHAGHCTSGLPVVWRMGIEPWIDPDGADADEVERIIRRCPSGALSFQRGANQETEYFDTTEIHLGRNGPYIVRGGVVLENSDFGEGASREHYALCRCGASRNKPYCDGSHWYAGFKDDERLTIERANRAEQDTGDEWIAVGTVDQYVKEGVYSISVKETAVALVRAQGRWHALSGKCPHQGGPLTEATICDGAIRCPWHGYDFSITDGKGMGNDGTVETFKIREQDGRIEIAAPAPRRSTWTVSHVMVETMVEWGLDTVFGIVGHSNLGLAEALRVQEARGKLRYIGVRHEGAAAFACSGYAKLSGRPAACLAIAGPGATNLLTGLWDAKVDRAPVLALTGQVNTQVMGPGVFQEIDLSSAFAAVSRFSQTVLPNSNYGELVSLAMKTALVERDVAHLIFPDEVQVQDAGKQGPAQAEGRVSSSGIAPPARSVDYALYRIGRARRPVIIVGYGAREGIGQVLQLADALRCPVITTFKAKGLLSDAHPLAAGVLGRSGTPVASWFMNQADLLVVFGASFSDHTGITTRKPIVQVDFERMALAKSHAVDELVWGDVGVTAEAIRERLPDANGWVDQRSELAARWEAWRAEKASRENRDRGEGVNSAIIFRRLAEAVPGDAVLCVDVGNNTYSFGRYFECQEQRILMSGYLGSIGFALPAAMGAWAASPERKIVSISGDGGFGQYMNELMTVAKYGMNIVQVVLNNGELGKISKEQRDGEWKVWQTDLHNVNFAEYARLCGIPGTRVESPGGLRAALEEALRADGPALVEIMSDPLLT